MIKIGRPNFYAGEMITIGTIVIGAWPSCLVWSPSWYCNRYLLCYKQTNITLSKSIRTIFNISQDFSMQAVVKKSILLDSFSGSLGEQRFIFSSSEIQLSNHMEHEIALLPLK